MKPEIWRAAITDTSAPPWPCPACKTGILELVDKSIKSVETVASAALAKKDDAWDPDWQETAFTCWLQCSVKKCGQNVAVLGSGGLEADWDPDQGGQTYINYYQPRAMWPMPDVFVVPDKCPNAVASELRASFALIWSDRSAAAGRLRVALERLLTSVGIKERMRVKGKAGQPGRNATIKLHNRILMLRQREEKIADNLMGIKWLGNTGSHESTPISLAELLSAYEVMSHALDELVLKRSKQVAKVAKTLTKKHQS